MALARLIRPGRTLPAILFVVAAVLHGCGEGEAPEHPGETDDRPGVEAPPTEVPAPLDVALTEVLERLLAGPTREEREAGRFSWFSEETAGMLRSVEVDGEGLAVVDFHDLRPVIPGASSSAGSEALLDELNGAVFRFPGVTSVEYRIEGSCSVFWEWLQYDCQVVTAPGG
jgi:hypothetical protein